MVETRSWLLGALAGVAALLSLCGPALAHPHMWVTVEATLLFENGAFIGISHKWTFDEAYTAMAIEGLDKNKDGKYDRAELAELAKVNVDALTGAVVGQEHESPATEAKEAKAEKAERKGAKKTP